ncbi:hypothetical protein Q9L58_009872 [Maublancomyces gigas]|uniref:Pyroglutamyl-peptidase I n=1 Tax=Discina gigas TaxID=1032678 RepID=A0ABR3G5N2_9PEZI
MPVIPSTPKPPITVYVTGFGPFRKVSRNPSWEIVSSFLPSTRVSSDLYNIDIVPHPDFVKVAYETVDTLIPTVHAEKTFDYILHVGVGVPGDYEIETVAHEKGYVKADVDGLIPGGLPAAPVLEGDRTGDSGKDGVTETDGGAVYRTELNVDNICKMIHAIVPKTPDIPLRVKASADAGRYMCEYIFRTSLRCATDPTRRVLFLHVPPENMPYGIEEGKQFLEKFVIAFVTEGERLRKERGGEL